MIASLLIKLGLLALTFAVVFWIEWTIPVRPEHASPPSATDDGRREVPLPGVSTVRSGPIPPVPQKSDSRDTSVRPAARLNLNQATAADLESLPGIGPVLAGRIIEYRRSKGAFRTVQELKLVAGIGAKKFDRVQGLLQVIPTAHPAGKEKKTT